MSLPPERLQPNPWNTNFCSPDSEAKLDAAIQRFGFFKPITVREIAGDSYEILGGEHRWEAAKRLGLTEIPVFNLGPIDDQRAKEISIADNARYGADDTLMLAELMREISENAEVQEFLPYTESDLASLFSATTIALDSLDELDLDDGFEDDKAPEVEVTRAPKTHAIMRFKVPIGDAERVTEVITRTEQRQGFTASDQLTNAGDALVHLLLGGEPK